MSEPTIDELLGWLDGVMGDCYHAELDYAKAIRTILEQHREQLKYAKPFDWNAMKLEAIRAFVERVEARYEDTPFTYPGEVFELMWKELAAMEKDNERTNDR